MQIVKRLGLGVLVLWLSTAIYLLLVDGRGLKKSVLRPTLEALGKQLFAAVAEDNEKEKLVEQYSDFIIRAEKREIPPQQIEQVAAEILNLTKEDSVISGRDALNILLPAEAHAAGFAEKQLSRTVMITPKAPNIGVATAGIMDPEALADRLRQIQAFHDEYKKISRHNKAIRDLRTQFTFCADSGLRVIVQDDAKAKILTGQLTTMSKELKELEKKRLLAWQQYRFVKEPGKEPYLVTGYNLMPPAKERPHHQFVKKDSIKVQISTN